MRAYVLHDIGDIRMETAADPTPKENEVIVSVKAVGICGSDIPRIYRTGAYSYPLIPGHEFAGVVTALGAGVDSCWKDKRVGVFPLIPCRSCEPCRNRQYELCRKYSYLGSRRDGGFAEYAAVPADNLLELPDEVSFEAAAMLEPMSVAVHAMRRMKVNQKDATAVCGLGTIGLLLVMFLREAGIQNLLVIGNKDFQRDKILRMDIPEECFCDTRVHNVDSWLQEKTGGRGVDVFFECVGKNETVQQAINNTAPNGKVQLIGNPYSDMKMDKAAYWKILRNQLTISGTWNSSFTQDEQDDWHYVLERLREHRICPEQFISHRFDMEELEQGMKIMRDKSEDYVKVMMVV